MSRTVIRVANILEQIANSPNGSTLAEITKKQDIPKSTAFDILASLQRSDMIYVSDVERTRFAIGYRAFAIGIKYQKSSHLINSAMADVLNLSTKLNKPVFLGRIFDNKVILIYKEEAQNSIIKMPSIGKLIPIYCTAVGKVLLAYSESNKTIINELELTKLTKNTIVDKNVLLEELEKIEHDGYAIEIGERDDLLYSIAAPIYNFENKLSGAISVSHIYNKDVDIQYEVDLIRQCAIDISRKMGYDEYELPPED
ncbi:MAG: IclR family transcriptional regulator [Vallitaleaceae bacterium]|nr:IclR family transcriptional regulator [Vallitaleaceae bacterium]